MWKVYQILKHTVSDNLHHALSEEISHIAEKISPDEFIEVIHTLYKTRNKKYKPGQLTLMFISGLTKNNFFDFVMFARGLSKK
jgi:hypothetical protein